MSHSWYWSRRARVLAAGLALAGAAALVTTAAGPAASARDGKPGGGARVVAQEQVGERLVDLTVESPALGGETAMVRLLTPDGWQQRQPGDTWPALYLMPGGIDNHATWTQESDVEDLPELREVLVVMPDGGLPDQPIGLHTNWWNKGAGGPPQWETFHLDELRGLLEDGYGAGDRRVAAGLSMGGFGAVSYAARRPGMFQAAASYSGPTHILQPAWVEFFPPWIEAAVGTDVSLIWGDPVEQREIWEAHDPYFLAENLKDTPVYLSGGDGNPGPLDPPGSEFDELEAFILASNQAASARFEEIGVPVTTDFHTGTHHPAYGEQGLHRSLPMLLDALQPGHGSN